MASYGHVRDLLPKEGAVDPAHDFAMNYELIEKNAKHVDAIVKAMKKADALYSQPILIVKVKPFLGMFMNLKRKKSA